MEITTKVNLEIIAKEEVSEMTNEKIEEFKARLRKDLIDELALEDEVIQSYDIKIEIEQEN